MRTFSSLLFSTLAFSLAALAQSEDYMRMRPACLSCEKIDTLVVKHNSELSPDKRLDLALQVARVIEKISLKNKSQTDQRREIYFALNATIQVLPDDFDSETCVALLDLRTSSPKNFDFVFWRFPINQQKSLIQRMRSFKEDKIRPNAEIPVAKAIEP